MLIHFTKSLTTCHLPRVVVLGGELLHLSLKFQITVMQMLKAASTSSMESKIWSRLPPELLEHILSLLPLKTFFNLRSTCKHFNSLLFTPSFISKYSSFQTQLFSSFLLFSHPQFLLRQFPLYDSMISQWRMLELPFLSLPPSSSSSANLISSSNGLLCFSLPNSGSFFICNLLAKTSRLVDFPTSPFHFTSVTLIPFSHGYKIFILSSKFSSDSAFVFDSKLDSWSQLSVLDSSILDREGVFFKGYLYFTTSNPFSIVGFDFEKGMWERMIKEVPDDLTFARLVNDNDGEKLYVIGGIGSHGISRSMKLWELREGERDWIEIVSVPEMMCRKFMSVCYHNYEHVYCFYHDGMICVYCSTWPEVLYFKISWQTWHWLPKCPSLPEKWSCGFKWFSFVPNLYAMV